MKTRTSVVAALTASVVLFGGVAAQAKPPVGTTMPMSTETCVSHHPGWAETDREAMIDAMSAGDFGAMASMMQGEMSSMMGGALGHMGWSR